MVKKYTTITLRSAAADRLSEIAKQNNRSRPRQIEWWINAEPPRASAKTRHATNRPRR